MSDERRCSHGNTFSERCIECRKVTLRALIRHSEESIQKWTGEIDALERKQKTE